MNCSYKKILQDNGGMEQIWISEKFTCLRIFQFIDFTYVYIFKLQQSLLRMGGIIFVCLFFYVNGTRLIYDNFFCSELIGLVDHFKQFEFVAAFTFFFWISYFSENLKILGDSVSQSKPAHHTFAATMSSQVLCLTLGVGFVYSLTKNKIRIPYYSSYLHLAVMILSLGFNLLCLYLGYINYYLLLIPITIYCFYIYFLFKFSAFDKFLEEKFRSTVYKNMYDLAYYYEPLTSEQLQELNKKKEKVKIDLNALSDSEDEEEDLIAKRNKQNDFKKILIQQLEEEFKEKPTLFEKIAENFVIDKNQSYLIYKLEEIVLIILSFILPSSNNFIMKTYIKIIPQYLGFYIALSNFLNMTNNDKLLCALFLTIIFYCALYFFSADNQLVFKRMVTICVVSSLINFISIIFLDIFEFISFYLNFEKIDFAIIRGLFRIIPLSILIKSLANRDRLVLGYAILMVSVTGISYLYCILKLRNIIYYGLTSINIKKMYRISADQIKVQNQLSLIIFFLGFVIILHLIYIYMRNQIGKKSFGYILITIGLFYIASNLLYIL